jgi:hypothetical protein
LTTPSSKWRCDVCGELIDGSSNGYVIWKQSSAMKSCGFKIVHKIKCDLKDHSSSSALDDFLGVDGMAKLLSHLSLGPIKQNLGQARYTDVQDMDEFVDLIRRVQTPFYENARTKFSSPALLSDFSDANEVLPYTEEHLKRIAAKY